MNEQLPSAEYLVISRDSGDKTLFRGAKQQNAIDQSIPGLIDWLAGKRSAGNGSPLKVRRSGGKM